MGRQLGIQSIEVGYPLLDVLSREAAPMPLSRIAREAGLPPSKAHRYLVSYIRVGLVAQDPDSSRYTLGPSALHLGLAAIRRLKILNVAEPMMQERSRLLNECMALAIWESTGPVVVLYIEAARPVGVNVRIGMRMPVLSSALGRVFLAWKDRVDTQDNVSNELAEKDGARHGLHDASDVDDLVTQVRSRGYAMVEAAMFAGLSAVAAPIFDYQGGLVAAVSFVGPIGAIDTGERSLLSKEIRDVAQAISEKLGAR